MEDWILNEESKMNYFFLTFFVGQEMKVAIFLR